MNIQHIHTYLRLALAGATLALLAISAQAADTTPPAATSLSAARAHMDAKRWAAGLEELRRINDTSNPDWHNLMGYGLRKSKTPDLTGAERHYNEALRLDPKHRGTLEYSGELFLMKGDLSGAESRLGTLEKVCGTSCPEHRTLKQAIERYKANGNKYVPEA